MKATTRYSAVRYTILLVIWRLRVKLLMRIWPVVKRLGHVNGNKWLNNRIWCNWSRDWSPTEISAI